MTDVTPPNPDRRKPELRVALVSAGLMLAIPFATKLMSRFGLGDAADFKERALMAILAGFIVLTGNTIPKRITSLTCRNAEPARVQAFHRFAGWTWVLTGLAFGLAWVLLPRSVASTATLIVVPLGMALNAYGWIALYTARRPAA